MRKIKRRVKYFFKGDGIHNSEYKYLKKALKWFGFNAGFGLLPLLLMAIVSWLTHGNYGKHQIDHLVYEGGIVMFVGIAMMGAINVDYLLSGMKFSGIEIFAIFIFPTYVAGFISIEFLLVCLKVLNKHALALVSKKTITFIVFSFLYCTLTKYTLYLKEDSYNV